MATRDDILRDLLARSAERDTLLARIGETVARMEKDIDAFKADSWSAPLPAQVAPVRGAEEEVAPTATEAAPAFEVVRDDAGEAQEVIVTGPTPAQRDRRAVLASHIGWENWRYDQKAGPGASPPLERAVATAAFIEGGLGWLRLYDRAFTLQQKPDVLRACIADVAETDTRLAEDLGADLLKHEGAGTVEIAEQTAKTAWGG